MRAASSVAVAMAAALFAGRAWAADAQPPAPAAGGDSAACTDVRVVVRGTRPKTSSTTLMETILAEVSPRASAPCDPDQRRSLANVVVEWTGADRARVRVELSEGGAPSGVAREVDLGGLAPDTVPLTLAIAADELLREARDRALGDASEAAGEPPPHDLAPAPESLLQPASRRWPLWSFGSSLAAEWFSSGVMLAGPDATLDWAMHPLLTLSTHVGVRAILADGGLAQGGVMMAGGAWLRFRLTGGTSGGTGVSTGVDAFVLANAAGATQATIVPGAALAGWRRLAGSSWLALDVGGGVPLLRLQVPSGPALGGAELRLRVSLMVDF